MLLSKLAKNLPLTELASFALLKTEVVFLEIVPVNYYNGEGRSIELSDDAVYAELSYIIL